VLIYTKDGYKEIKDIEVGDEVYSENPETGEQGLKKVINVFVKDINELVHLKVGDQEIKTTLEHPFWVEETGWVDAGELKSGDRLVMYSGEILEVMEAYVEYLDKPVKVYNFEVEDWHTYFVSEYNVLVHNAGCGGAGGTSEGTNRPPNLSPKNAKRNGAFREAKRRNGIPVSEQPKKVTPNVDKRGNSQPGKIYEFENGVKIRDDSAGHIFNDNPIQNRGPHFNDPAGNHYDY